MRKGHEITYNRHNNAMYVFFKVFFHICTIFVGLHDKPWGRKGRYYCLHFRDEKAQPQRDCPCARLRRQATELVLNLIFFFFLQ